MPAGYAIAQAAGTAIAQKIPRTAGRNAIPGESAPFDPVGAVRYLPHSGLRKMVARGFLQSSFRRFPDDSNGESPVLLASILFGMVHLHFGMIAVLLTIMTGRLFGAIYMRHRNLAEVTPVHFAAGVAAFNTGLLQPGERAYE